MKEEESEKSESAGTIKSAVASRLFACLVTWDSADSTTWYKPELFFFFFFFFTVRKTMVKIKNIKKNKKFI